MKKRRGPKSLRDLPIVEVLWDDTTGHPGWYTATEAPELPFARCWTVGRLVSRGAGGITLCATISPDDETGPEVGDVWRIPQANVRKIRRLR